jgi:hypothetical protein
VTEKFTHWWKATRSGSTAGNCVEVAFAADATVGVRDSKAGNAGPVLEVPFADWAAFVRSVRGGAFDLA